MTDEILEALVNADTVLSLARAAASDAVPFPMPDAVYSKFADELGYFPTLMQVFREMLPASVDTAKIDEWETRQDYASEGVQLVILALLLQGEHDSPTRQRNEQRWQAIIMNGVRGDSEAGRILKDFVLASVEIVDKDRWRATFSEAMLRRNSVQ